MIFDPNGFFGFLNLRHLRIVDQTSYLSRPTSPPLSDSRDPIYILNHLNRADFGLFLFTTAFTSLSTYSIASLYLAGLPTSADRLPVYQVKRYSYLLGLAAGLSYGAVLGITNAYLRVSGQVFNGREWRTKQNRFRLYSNAPVAQ